MARDILDQIDGALHDWEVSEDAMRWIPEEDRTPEPPRRFSDVFRRMAVSDFRGLIEGRWDRLDHPEYPRARIGELAGLVPASSAFRSAVLAGSFERSTAAAAQMEQAMERLRQTMMPTIEQVNRSMRTLARLGINLDRKPRPTDLREGETVKDRALRLRQSRNTGPAKPLPDYQPPRHPVRHTPRRRRHTRGRHR